MADIICTECGQPNPEELEECQFCGSPLRPSPDSNLEDSQPITPGVEPTRKKTTGEFEKIHLSLDQTIHPGELPTPKNTADLEHALPSWLRSLRKGQALEEGQSLAEPSAEEPPPAAEPDEPAPDLLSGLQAAGSEQEQVPDWLTGLQAGKFSEPEPEPEAPEDASMSGLDDQEWMKRLENGVQDATPEPPAPDQAPASPGSDFEAPSASGADQEAPDWLKNLQAQQPAAQPGSSAFQGDEDLPDWLSGMQAVSMADTPAANPSQEPTPTEPDWLNQPDQESLNPESAQPPAGSEPFSGWQPADQPPSETPDAAPADDLPDWLSRVEEPSEPSEPESGARDAFFEQESQPAGNASPGKPDWLTRLQADVNAEQEASQHKDDFEVDSNTPAFNKESEPLPDWLTNIEPDAPIQGSSPALITDGQETPPGESPEESFAMEMPEWLSRLNPDTGPEKSAESAEDQPEEGGLEAAELPTWVQAMRPVESVVESKTAALDEDQVTEHIGPLAGLNGVLPSLPGHWAASQAPGLFRQDPRFRRTAPLRLLSRKVGGRRGHSSRPPESAPDLQPGLALVDHAAPVPGRRSPARFRGAGCFPHLAGTIR